MADPLSIIGGVASILQISSMVISLIKSAKGAPTERQRLLIEINATTALCQTLRDYAEIDAESWHSTLDPLSQSDVSLLEQFRKSLDYLHRKLTPESREASKLQVWRQNFHWPFSKSEVAEVIASIERQKSLFNVALANDTLRLSAAILDETQRNTKKLDAIQISQREQCNNESFERKEKSLAQLTTIDFQATHADISSRRAKNTGQWFLDSPEYDSWRSRQSSGVMWCRGIPGAGKTVLSSLIIDSFRDIGMRGNTSGS